MSAHPFARLAEAREQRTPCDVHGGWCREHEAQAPCSFGPVDVSTAQRMRETMRPKFNPVIQAAADAVFGPEVGEVAQLPGGLQATAGLVPFGERCEMCSQMIVGVCYGVGVGGGWSFFHPACLAECR